MSKSLYYKTFLSEFRRLSGPWEGIRQATRHARGIRDAGSGIRCFPRHFWSRIPDPGSRLQDVSRKIFVANDVGEHPIDVSLVNHHGLLPQIGRLEREFVEQALHHRMQAAGADVL